MLATKLSVLWLSMALSAAPAAAALITAQDFGSSLMLSMRGDIEPSDEAVIRDYVARAKSGAHVSLYIASDGGDVRAAMGIGRKLRSVNAHVRSDKCYSACVLVFIGGVDRSISTSKDKVWGLGLHRLYFGSLDPSLSMAEISSKRRALAEEVRTYISSMNVSAQLFDLMEATPPEKMKVLSAEEVTALGLNQPDPVWDESVVAKEAHYYSISSKTFRQRRAALESLCPYPNPSRTRTVVQEQAHIDCEEAARWGLPVTEYLTRWARYDAWGRATIRAAIPRAPRSQAELDIASRCRNLFMVQGASACAS